MSVMVAISIRAPTRGATVTAACMIAATSFQSALPRGERRANTGADPILPDFNPRSHEGSDQLFQEATEGLKISIRAPTRGATKPKSTGLFTYIISIRAPTRGATRRRSGSKTTGKFQSALPRGERPWQPRPCPCNYYFNPRSHEGSDRLQPGQGCGAVDFNPRSHEGSDQQHPKLLLQSFEFQSALPRGERPEAVMCIGTTTAFQSALPRGERRVVTFMFLVFPQFQSALPRGERPGRNTSQQRHLIFQSALPRGERPRLTGCPLP